MNAKAQIEKTLDRILAMPAVEPDESIADKKATWERLRQLKSDAGRFFDCSFVNYNAPLPAQKKVVARLSNCATKIDEFIAGRTGLILWGRIGTGKDHMACALLRHAAHAGHSARWVNGLDLYERSSQAWGEGNRSRLIRQYITPDCLVISDPVFQRNWSPAKAETLARVVRGRYDKGKPTWITANAKDLNQLREMCVPDVYDRIAERAVIENFNWPSYRQGQDVEF